MGGSHSEACRPPRRPLRLGAADFLFVSHAVLLPLRGSGFPNLQTQSKTRSFGASTPRVWAPLGILHEFGM